MLRRGTAINVKPMEEPVIKNVLTKLGTFGIAALVSLVVVLQFPPALAQQKSDTLRTKPQHTPTQRDGQHDFDFEIGTWKTHLWRLLHPLTGSTKWVEYEAQRSSEKFGMVAPTWWSSRSTARQVTSKVCPCVYTILNPASGASISPTAAAVP